jgi:hypothetical protein
MRTLVAATCAALFVAGCASYDGRGLATNSSAAQVESTMGPPAMRVAAADGGSVLYYPRGPLGRHSYAVTIGPDGAMRGIDQRLTMANINRLQVGTTTAKEVRELFGPPHPQLVSRLALSKREVWEYPWLDYQEKRILWVQFSEDGILREAMNSRDDYHESPGSGLN